MGDLGQQWCIKYFVTRQSLIKCCIFANAARGISCSKLPSIMKSHFVLFLYAGWDRHSKWVHVPCEGFFIAGALLKAKPVLPETAATNTKATRCNVLNTAMVHRSHNCLLALSVFFNHMVSFFFNGVTSESRSDGLLKKHEEQASNCAIGMV